VDRRRFLRLAAAGVLFGPSAARAAAPVLAIATCDAEDRLAIVDVLSGRVIRHVRCPSDPRSVERIGGGDALVCHTAAGVVSILDRSTAHLRAVVQGFEEPRYTAAHPRGPYAFVTDSGTRELVTVDLARARVVGRLRLEEWARHVTVDDAGTTLWVGLGSASRHVAVVDVSRPERPHLERLISPPFRAHDVAFEPGGARVWVTSGNAGTLAVYDRRGRLLVERAADAAPQHLTFTHGAVHVTSGAAGTLRVLSLAHEREVHAGRIPVGSYNVEARHGVVLTASLDSGMLSILDRRGHLLRQVRVGRSSHDACFLG
jgi:DNA-binding beta-propeller fold protein YncE